MESISRTKKFLKDKRGVFGLTSVQAFFAILLAIALLAYTIVVVFGVLQNSSVFDANSLTTLVSNETGWVNSSHGGGYTLLGASNPGFTGVTILQLYNRTGSLINVANATVSAAGVVTNTSAITLGTDPANITYLYTFNGVAENQANGIIGNTSVGVSSFFASINPVYAILAVMVIILVLIVLVRVVTGSAAGTGQFGSSTGPQL